MKNNNNKNNLSKFFAFIGKTRKERNKNNKIAIEFKEEKNLKCRERERGAETLEQIRKVDDFKSKLFFFYSLFSFL